MAALGTSEVVTGSVLFFATVRKMLHILGNHIVQAEVEKCVAHYLGVEAAICFPMGFGTNSMNIPSLVDKVRIENSLFSERRSAIMSFV